MSAADPDLVVGAVVAVRRFLTDERGRLRPLHMREGYVWAPGVNVAQCGQADHAAPALECTCGLYAVNDPARLPMGPVSGMVTGVVDLMGRMEVGDWGYRAERGSVVALAPADTAGMSSGAVRASSLDWEVITKDLYRLMGAFLVVLVGAYALVHFGLGVSVLWSEIGVPPLAMAVVAVALGPLAVVQVLARLEAASAPWRDRRALRQAGVPETVDLERLALLYPDAEVYTSEAEMLAAHTLTPAPEPQESTPSPAADDPASPDFWRADL